MHISIAYVRFLLYLCHRMNSKRPVILLLALAFLMGAMPLRAEVVTLRSGKTVSGTILFQDEQVLVIKDDNGARFQYPMSDVLRVGSPQPAEEQAPNALEDRAANEPGTNLERTWGAHLPHTVIRIELQGGGAYQGADIYGGAYGIDLMIGSRRISRYPMLIGGAVGFHSLLFPKGSTGAAPQAGATASALSFVPIAVVLRAPFYEAKHAPEAGVSVGYGIGVAGGVTGGLYAALDLGWRYAYSQRGAFFFGLTTAFQQAQATSVEQVLGATTGTEPAYYVGQSHLNLLHFGAKMAIAF